VLIFKINFWIETQNGNPFFRFSSMNYNSSFPSCFAPKARGGICKKFSLLHAEGHKNGLFSFSGYSHTKTKTVFVNFRFMVCLITDGYDERIYVLRKPTVLYGFFPGALRFG